MTIQKKLGSRILAMALSLALVFTLMSVQASASTDEGATTALTNTQNGGTVTMPWGQVFAVNQDKADNTTAIIFGGEEWLVIGAKGIGVASDNGTMTLFKMDVVGGFHAPIIVPFNLEEQLTNNYGTNGSVAQSNLKTEMDKLTASGTGLFTEKELAAIRKVTLKGGASDSEKSGMHGDDVIDALLWPLDVAEASSLTVDIRHHWAYDSWWLRSPGASAINAVYASGSKTDVDDDEDGPPAGPPGYIFREPVTNSQGIRPATKLDLDSVLFTSNGRGGKPNVVSDILVERVQSTETQKLTLLDSSLSAGTVTAKGNTTIKVSVNGATANKSLSAVITDSTGKIIKYYGKIATIDGNGNVTDAKLTLPVSLDADNVLKVFAEEINGNYITDYASTPTPVALTMDTLSGTVSISGEWKFGETLTATVKDTNNTGVLSYQWKRGDANIDLANAATYTTVVEDIGQTISCVVTSSVEGASISGVTTPIAKVDGPATPVAPIIDFLNETVATVDTLEYKVKDGNWTDCTNTMTATDLGWVGDEIIVQLRIPATTTQKESATVSITIPARPSAPLLSAFVVTKPTIIDGTDGKLNGITSLMEYHTGDNTYTSGKGSELTNITAETTYTIRNKATATAFASKTVSVEISNKEKAAITFEDKSVDYDGFIQVHQMATTTETGGEMSYSYKAITGALDDNNMPKDAGTYTVTASYISDNHFGTADVTLTINKLPLTIEAEDQTMYYAHDLPSLTLKYTGFITGETENNALNGKAYSAVTIADGKSTGSYDITVDGNATAKNYDITTEKGTLTVLERKLANATDAMPSDPTEETVVIPTTSVPIGSNLADLKLSLSYTVTTEDQLKLDSATTGLAEFVNIQNLEISLIDTLTDDSVQPNGEITIFIPYPTGTDKNDSFVLMHIMASGVNEIITPTKNEKGLQFKVSSLSPFAIGWTKYVAPGGGGGTSPTTYTITATVGVGGTVNTSETVYVTEGDSASFTFTPNKGYQIADVLINGNSTGAKKTYVFTNVRANQTIHATFKKAGHINPPTGVEFVDVSDID